MVATVRTIEPGEGRVVLLVVAHADDVALFVGGTVAAWADAGWRVVVVRVTDDRWDSVGSDEASTVSANRDEFEQAAAILGVHEIVELGYPTDTLGDLSTVELREQVIHAVRTYRPYALVSFDPYAMYGEDNLDHITVARAVDESFWTSQFDLHHPEHFDEVSADTGESLAPHGCFERWYVGGVAIAGHVIGWWDASPWRFGRTAHLTALAEVRTLPPRCSPTSRPDHGSS